MLEKIRSNKKLNILYLVITLIAICILCLPIFQILLEIISNAGRIVGSYIRLNC